MKLKDSDISRRGQPFGFQQSPPASTPRNGMHIPSLEQ